MEGLAKSKNVTPDTETRQNNPKMAVWGQITPLRENCQNSSIKVQQRTPINFFGRISCRSLPLQRENKVIVPVTKHSLFRRHFAPLWPRTGRQNFNTWHLSSTFTYACKIVSGSVKVCRSYSRKQILSKYI